MSVAVAIVPAAPVAAKSACRINVTGADVNDASAYDATAWPSEPAILYYLSFECAGEDTGKSQVFQPAQDGSFEFNSYVFPAAGSWTVHLRKVSDDSSVANVAATVS